MSQKRVTGLASAFEPSGAPPLSGVSSIASRFDGPSTQTTEPKVSEKLSGIANRFGATVADTPEKAKKEKKERTEKKDPDEDNMASPTVVAERPDFSAISSRFASGRAGVKDEKLEERPGTFARAASAFQKMEEENRPRGDGVVGMLKKQIEDSKSGKAEKIEKKDKGEEVKETPVVSQGFERVGSLKSRFEGGNGKVELDEKEKEETLTSRFQSATKVFGENEKTESSAPQSSTFQDASKIFAGGAN